MPNTPENDPNFDFYSLQLQRLFGSQAMRLLREDWMGEKGTKLLSEELFAMFQAGIPFVRNGPVVINTPPGQQAPALIIDNNGDGPPIQIRQRGKTVAYFNDQGELVPVNSGTSNGLPLIPPLIVWPEPADITEGDALSATQLNAVAYDPFSEQEIPGTYVYTPPSGTVLSVGDDQVLRVQFIPDSSAYSRAYAQTLIDVVAAGIVYIGTTLQSTSPASSSMRSRSFSVNAGDLIVVAIGFADSSTSGITYSISDTDGNSYSQIESYVEGSYLSGTSFAMLGLWYAIAANTGSFDFEYTPSASVEDSCAIVTFSGVDQVTPLVGSSSNFEDEPSSSTFSTGSISASADDMVFAVFGGSNVDTGTVTSGFSWRTGSGLGYTFDDVAVAGSVDVTVDRDGGEPAWSFVAIGASFKKA